MLLSKKSNVLTYILKDNHTSAVVGLCLYATVADKSCIQGECYCAHCCACNHIGQSSSKAFNIVQYFHLPPILC